jgi:hippurate hydrolase
MRLRATAVYLFTVAFLPLAHAQSLAPNLLATYKDLHSHPELSHHEERTAGILADGLRKAGYAVTDHVGVYPNGSRAFGVVGILKNGAGATELIRGDMDALPIVEETGLPYASHVRTKNAAGRDVGVMHACGHDVHTTVLLGTARALAEHKSSWHGTLMIVGQPSEETIDGAKAMLADHLYDRFGKPDSIIGLHDTNLLPAGKLGFTPGPAMASSTSVNVLIRGIGGHGAYPNLGRDPVTLAALYITQIQTIVSREEDPRDPAVVTVGSIHGGTRGNIIPDEVKLELTTRAFTAKARQVILDGLQQMAAGLTTSFHLPPDKAAVVTVLDNESTPALYNDPAQTVKLEHVLTAIFGASNVVEVGREIGSEDVGVFSLDSQIPITYFWLGAMEPGPFAAAAAKGERLPSMHTSRFDPDPTPTLTSGIRALTAAAETLMQ